MIEVERHREGETERQMDRERERETERRQRDRETERQRDRERERERESEMMLSFRRLCTGVFCKPLSGDSWLRQQTFKAVSLYSKSLYRVSMELTKQRVLRLLGPY